MIFRKSFGIFYIVINRFKTRKKVTAYEWGEYSFDSKISKTIQIRTKWEIKNIKIMTVVIPWLDFVNVRKENSLSKASIFTNHNKHHH